MFGNFVCEILKHMRELGVKVGLSLNPETPIEEVEFSVRAYNCLKRAGVNTLGDLTAKSEVEMMKIRNLGKKSLKEVIDKIKDMGLKFREED